MQGASVYKHKTGRFIPILHVMIAQRVPYVPMPCQCFVPRIRHEFIVCQQRLRQACGMVLTFEEQVLSACHVQHSYFAHIVADVDDDDDGLRMSFKIFFSHFFTHLLLI